jgi:1-pyrroline-5-carboxylate dehydrogenase
VHNQYPSNTAPRLFKPGSPEITSITTHLGELSSKIHHLSMVINGEKIEGKGEVIEVYLPHQKMVKYAEVALPSKRDVDDVLANSLLVRKEWANSSVAERVAIFKKVADLIEFKYKDLLVAATMYGQSKSVFQGEIDAAAGLIDAIRYNAVFAEQIDQMQPPESDQTNIKLDYRPLEGFVYAITPFNFTTTAAILSSAPALMGNVVIWKPSLTAMLPAQILMDIYKEAGLPDGVVNLVPGRGAEISDILLDSEFLAGIYFTGSTKVFQELWKEVGNKISKYRNFPRLVGETGGKGFVIAHPSADRKKLVSGLIRSAYEYQGQKCSACSRAYIPESIWNEISIELIDLVENLSYGDISQPKNFMGAVIDENSFNRLKRVLSDSKSDTLVEILAGGKADDSDGYFISPTLLLAKSPDHQILCQEFFGPILSIFVYPDNKFEETLQLIDETSPYALTGSIYAENLQIIEPALRVLRNSAGSMNVNDKPTGAVMGKHPFGGSRASGTNDKAGSLQGLLRWTSPRVIRNVEHATTEINHPHQG